MVGDPVVAKVVGPDLFRSLAGADLAPAILRDRFLLLALLHLVEPGAQHLHRLCAILDLRLLVLLRHHDAARKVGDADGGVGGVDALAARAARAEGVDPQILVVDLDVDLLGFRQHRDCDRRGVDAAARFRRGHPLDPMDAALVLQLAVRAAPLDHRDHFLEAAAAGVVARHDLEPPAVTLGGTAPPRRAPPRRRRFRRGSRA